MKVIRPEEQAKYRFEKKDTVRRTQRMRAVALLTSQLASSTVQTSVQKVQNVSKADNIYAAIYQHIDSIRNLQQLIDVVRKQLERALPLMVKSLETENAFIDAALWQWYIMVSVEKKIRKAYQDHLLAIGADHMSNVEWGRFLLSQDFIKSFDIEVIRMVYESVVRSKAQTN